MEKRQSGRKDLWVKAYLTPTNGLRMTVRTVDIAKFGMGLSGLPRQLDVGLEVQIAFELPLGGQVHNINVGARVSHCTNTPEGFRVGVQFLDLNSDGAATLAQYVGN